MQVSYIYHVDKLYSLGNAVPSSLLNRDLALSSEPYHYTNTFERLSYFVGCKAWGVGMYPWLHL